MATLFVSSRKTASFEVLRELCGQAGGVKALREKVVATGIVKQMDAPVLESWMREPSDFRSIDPFEKTARLIESTKNLLPLRWICGRLGGFYVAGPDKFSRVLGKGAQTWFVASLRLHDLRSVVINSFLDSPDGNLSIDAEQARLIARSWATVFGWIEGFLRVHEDTIHSPAIPATGPASALLFRTTASWQVMQYVLSLKKSPPRTEISVTIAKPFGEPVGNSIGSLRYPNKDTLDKWAQPPPSANPPGKGCASPLDYTLALCKAANSAHPLEWLVERSGGLTDFPQIHSAGRQKRHDVLLSWEHTMVKLAELDAAIARALLDGVIDPEERVRLRKDWSGVVAWMEAFVEEW